MAELCAESRRKFDESIWGVYDTPTNEDRKTHFPHRLEFEQENEEENREGAKK